MADDDDDSLRGDRELQRWNAPYVHQEYPLMLYRAATGPSRQVEVKNRIVQNADEEQQAQAGGWLRRPDKAVAAERARQEAIVAARQEQAHRALEEAIRRALRAEREELTRAMAVRSDEPDVDRPQKAQPLDPLDTAPDKSPLVTLREAATQIGTISKDTLRRMGKRGEARIIRVGGRDMISLTEVARLKATPKIRFR